MGVYDIPGSDVDIMRKSPLLGKLPSQGKDEQYSWIVVG
jgi:hypothetical protein